MNLTYVVSSRLWIWFLFHTCGHGDMLSLSQGQALYMVKLDSGTGNTIQEPLSSQQGGREIQDLLGPVWHLLSALHLYCVGHGQHQANVVNFNRLFSKDGQTTSG